MIAEPADGSGCRGIEHVVVIKAKEVAVTSLLPVPRLAQVGHRGTDLRR